MVERITRLGAQPQPPQQNRVAFSSHVVDGVSKIEYAHSVLQHVVCGLCREAGFAKAEQSATDVLTEVLERCMVSLRFTKLSACARWQRARVFYCFPR